MAGTGDYVSMVDSSFEISFDCFEVAPTWTNYQCAAAEIAVAGGDRAFSSSNVFCSEGAIITLGKKNPFTITATVLYTENTGATDGAWKDLWDAFQTALTSCDVGFRWAPKGAATGNFRFTACGILTDTPPPTGAAGDGAPIAVGAVIQVEEVILDVIP